MYLKLKPTKTIIKSTIGFIIMGGAIMSCSQSDLLENQPETQFPIHLESSVSGLKTRLQNGQIENERQVSFFVTKEANVNNVVYDNVSIQADGGGGFSYSQPMYYPMDNSKVDFYALHPYDGEVKFKDGVTNLDFTVKANQTVANEFLHSDLLYAAEKSVARTKETVKLQFKHKLSKFNFTIIAGNGMNLAELNTVSALNMKTGTNLNLETGNISEATGSPTEILAFGVRGTAESENSIEGVEAIVVPQLIAKDQKLFRIRVGSIDYYYTNPEEFELENGKSYNYKLTIHQNGISVSSEITEWIESDPITGEGVSEE